MELPFFYLHDLGNDPVVTLGEETSKHVVQVLRLKPGMALQLTNGAGTLCRATILDDHKKKCTVKLEERKFFAPKAHQTCVAMSLLKNASRFEWFLEKATELGVTEIVPLVCDRTEKQHFRYERMQQIVISAMLQSQQVWLPRLQPPSPLQKLVATPRYAQKYIAHCADGQKNSLKSVLHPLSTQVLIGPKATLARPR